jgi:hypothetical protein
LLPVNLDKVGLPTEILSPLNKGRIQTIADLRVASVTRPREIQDLGAGAIAELTARISFVIKSGPRSVGVAATPVIMVPRKFSANAAEAARGADVDDAEPLSIALAKSLDCLKPLDADVLKSRIGYGCTVGTLEDIGVRLGVTRERARQREDRAVKTLRTKFLWPTLLESHLDNLLAQRTEPVYLDLIGVEDAWLGGFEDRIPLLSRLIVEFTTRYRYFVWHLRGRPIVTRISENSWNVLVEHALADLAEHTQQGHELTKSEVKIFLESVASRAIAPELGDDLFAIVQRRIHFTTGSVEDGEVLVSVGRSLAAAVGAVLGASSEPLHLAEIIKRSELRTGKRYALPYYRTALAAVGAYPFRRGLYGLPRHLGLDSKDVEVILSEVEGAITRHVDGRQWHTSELLAELGKKSPNLAKPLNTHTLNVLLRRSSKLRYLRRFVWVARSHNQPLDQVRRNIADLCIAALTQAGRPLSGAELRAAVSRVRGIGSQLMLQPSPQMGRLGRGLWGLVDRDFGLSPSKRKQTMDALERLLEERKLGCGRDELLAGLASIGCRLPTAIDVDRVVGLALADGRFRLTRRGILRLTQS